MSDNSDSEVDRREDQNGDNGDNTIPEAEENRPENGDENQQGQNFLLPTIKQKASNWSLPKSLADFFQESCESYLTEKELEEFTKVPAPKNLKMPIKLDHFMRSLLEKKGFNKLISIDEEMQKIHQKLYQITGPLGLVWSSIQSFLTGERQLRGARTRGNH